MNSSSRNDRQLWLALAGGVLVWGALYWMYTPAIQWSWPLVHVGRFALIVLIYPLLEEIAFRGLLQGWLLERAWGRKRVLGLSAANALTSVAFAAAHLLHHSPLWALAVLPPSLVYGHFRERHGGIATPILLHVFYNFGYAWLFLAPAG